MIIRREQNKIYPIVKNKKSRLTWSIIFKESNYKKSDFEILWNQSITIEYSSRNTPESTNTNIKQYGNSSSEPVHRLEPIS